MFRTIWCFVLPLAAAAPASADVAPYDPASGSAIVVVIAVAAGVGYLLYRRRK